MKVICGAQLIVCFLLGSLFAQELKISGMVVGKSGNPIPGVKVELIEKNISVITNSIGEFVFEETAIKSDAIQGLINNSFYNSATGRLSFNLDKSDRVVNLKIFSSNGKVVEDRSLENLAAGKNVVNVFSQGSSLARSIYFIQLDIDNTKKIFKIAPTGSTRELKKNNSFNKRVRQNYTLNFSKNGFKDKDTVVNGTDIAISSIKMLQYPTVSVSSISEGEQYSFGDSIDIEALANDPDGNIDNVSFYINSKLYDVDSIGDYKCNWNTLRANIGTVSIIALAQDDDGLTAADTVSISINFNSERLYTYEIVNTYDHDNSSYCQGLVHADGIFYEGSGLYGESTLRKVEVVTGNVLKNLNLGSQYFGEGITIWNDTIYQLTWRENVIFAYNKDTFEKYPSHSNPHDGWGITHDGNELILSDGSSNLYFWNPHTITENSSVRVTDKNGYLSSLNELEYFYEKVFANIYQTNKIAIIDPGSGKVLGKISFAGLPDFSDPNAEVLNGIAYDPIGDRIFITGKHWSNLYEVKLKLSN